MAVATDNIGTEPEKTTDPGKTYLPLKFPSGEELSNTEDGPNNGFIKITIKERRGAQNIRHIFLPQQSGFQFTDGASYNDLEQSNLFRAIGAGFNALKGQGEGLIANLQKRAEGFDDGITSGLGNFSADAAAAALLAGGGLPFIGSSVGNFALQQGAAIDKGIRTRFNENPIRKYSLEFQLSPSDEKENETIHNIIEVLRAYTYASKGDNTFALNYPPEMIVEFYHKNKPNKFMPILLPSFLESVATNYNPNTVAMHEDGGMEQYNLSLSFVETKRLIREELETLIQNGKNEERHQELYAYQQAVLAAAQAAEAEALALAEKAKDKIVI